jgi:hypothetical protein
VLVKSRVKAFILFSKAMLTSRQAKGRGAQELPRCYSSLAAHYVAGEAWPFTHQQMTHMRQVGRTITELKLSNMNLRQITYIIPRVVQRRPARRST